MNNNQSILIHTSDRLAFKNCRRAWYWSSPIRQSLRTASTPEALWFGTAVHHGLEAFYLGQDYQKALEQHCAEHKQDLVGKEPSLEQDDRFYELFNLALGMLQGYQRWVGIKNLNNRFIVVGTEIRFRVPLDIKQHARVYYVGKADALVYDNTTKLLWVVEFKTAAQFSSIDFLSWDEQCGSYVWAFECVRNGYGAVDIDTLIRPELFWDATRVEGVLYDDLRKKVPAQPRVLIGGNLSVNKTQDTTYEVFYAYLEENGYSPDGYKDFLDFLLTKPNNFFRRTKVRRNPAELLNIGINIHAEATDMCNHDLPLYPNPGYRASNCQRCAFQGPCLAMNDDIVPDMSDYIVKDSFAGDEFFETGSPEGGELHEPGIETRA